MNKIILAILCAITVGIGAWFSISQKKNEKLDITGFAFPEPAQLANVSLTSHQNQPVTEDSFKGRWTFIYVGYTFCPDACPATMTVLNQLHGRLKEKGIDDTVNMMLVSVDPERDTIEKLKEYVAFFNPSFSAATGTPAAIQDFTSQVSAIYVIPEDRSDPNYLVDHSSSVMLIDPDAAVHAVFTPPQTAENLANDFVKLSNRYN